MPMIFISHSTSDKPIARALMDLLQTQFGLVREDFFLTSDEELRVGGDWIEQIRVEMKDAKVVLALITPNYLESQFCLCELGAAWINEQALIPVIVPPLDHNALNETPYRSWAQSNILNSLEDMLRLGDTIKDLTGKHVSMTRFSTRATDFYNEKLDPYIKELKKKEIISPSIVKQLREENASLKQAYNEAESDIKQLEIEKEKILSFKDAEEIKEYVNSQMDEWESFVSLVEEAAEKLNPLPQLVASVLYHDLKDDYGFSRQEDNTELRSLESEGFIYFDEGWQVQYEHPAMNKAHQALMNLKSFINNNIDIIGDRFYEEYGVMLGIKYTPFWNAVLGKKVLDSTR